MAKSEFYLYDEMLSRAKAKLPQTTGSEVLFSVPKADVWISGSRTEIRNFLDLCDVIDRKPEHMLKYLNRELATPGNMDGPRLILKGKIGPNQVNQRISDYVKEFVLCPACGRHETVLLKEDRVTIMKCNACGAQNSVRAIA